jgi:hypothetical protein
VNRERRMAYPLDCVGGMMRALTVALSFMVFAGHLSGQSRGQVKRILDDFTRDTIWRTNYGRLDEARGCPRSNLALVFELERGPVAQRARLAYEWIDIPDPFHKASQLNATGAALNIDGHIVQLTMDSAFVQPRSILDSKGQQNEKGKFVLPDSGLIWLASSQETRIRIVGAGNTCDGIMENNLRERIRELLSLSR